MTETGPRQIQSVEELLHATQLAQIQYYEVSGRRFDGFGEPSVPPEDDANVEGRAQVQVMQRLEGDTLAVRLRAEVQTSEGHLVADVAAFFRSAEQLSVPGEVAFGFAQRVASPIVRPYLREAVQTTAVRLGMVAPLLAPLDQDGAEILPRSLP